MWPTSSTTSSPTSPAMAASPPSEMRPTERALAEALHRSTEALCHRPTPRTVAQARQDIHDASQAMQDFVRFEKAGLGPMSVSMERAERLAALDDHAGRSNDLHDLNDARRECLTSLQASIVQDTVLSLWGHDCYGVGGAVPDGMPQENDEGFGPGEGLCGNHGPLCRRPPGDAVDLYMGLLSHMDALMQPEHEARAEQVMEAFRTIPRQQRDLLARGQAMYRELHALYLDESRQARRQIPQEHHVWEADNEVDRAMRVADARAQATHQPG